MGGGVQLPSRVRSVLSSPLPSAVARKGFPKSVWCLKGSGDYF